ncbi:MAG TPA: hypothetical protein PKL84_02385 [Candidatus Hydrogenedentes bacterium]|nr:hypothetical protein [Candidatus Hydrogenedentota bacterium]
MAAIFTSTARVAVLRVFLLDPTRAYYQRQIEAASGHPLRAVQRELDRLMAAGLLYRRDEGNRAYYQIDPDFPLYAELRALMLKTASSRERLRGIAASNAAVRLCFLSADGARALVVLGGAARPALDALPGIEIEMLTSDEFIEALRMNRAALDPYVRDGCDLLGRREDVIWRRIEEAGYTVRKGEGVP